jgi:hypothetical protein
MIGKNSYEQREAGFVRTPLSELEKFHSISGFTVIWMDV